MFEAQHFPRGETYVLRLSGDLDLASASEVSRELGKAILHGCPKLIVDLSDVSFLDSSGLHVLLEATTRAQASRVGLALANLPAGVRKVLTLTATESHFTIVRLED